MPLSGVGDHISLPKKTSTPPPQRRGNILKQAPGREASSEGGARTMAHEENEYVFVLTQKVASASSNPGGSCDLSAEEEDAVAITPLSTASFSSLDGVPVEQEATPPGSVDSDDDDGSDDSVEVEQLPVAMPFLPALDASTEITLHEGYMEAVEGVQRHLDSRLLAYSQYQQMVKICFFAEISTRWCWC